MEELEFFRAHLTLYSAWSNQGLAGPHVSMVDVFLEMSFRSFLCRESVRPPVQHPSLASCSQHT